MGFGCGPKMNRYRLGPSALPRSPSRAHVRYLNNDDRQALVDCYQRVAERTHGLMDKTVREDKQLFERPEHRLVGYKRDGQLGGYLVFAFEKGETFLANDLRVHELIYETPQALAGLMAFLHTQADQIRFILFDSQDAEIHHLFRDPRDDSGQLIPGVYHQTNTQGVGLMYRVLDVPGILRKLEGRNFGGQTLTLLLSVEDSFPPENAGSALLRWEDGRLGGIRGPGEPDVEVRLNVADFSSLLAGTIRFASLYRYSLAGISDPAYVPALDRLFAVARPPMCTTSF